MGKYPVIKDTGNLKHWVLERVYTVFNIEVFKADTYVTFIYKRIKVNLASGKQAWAYIENSD
jgi:hypothetical protein